MVYKPIFLWLNSNVNPFETTSHWSKYSPFSTRCKIVWCPTYIDFTKYCTINGLPDAICFSHDIDKRKIKTIKNGVDAIKWLNKYCNEYKCKFPMYSICENDEVKFNRLERCLNKYAI